MIFVRSIFLLMFLLLQSVLAANAQNVLWSAGMEGGDLSEWSKDGCGGEYNSGLADATASNGEANTGTWSARLDITTPSAPESGTRLFRWCEPQRYPQLYYSAWFFIPTNYSAPNWWDVWQWKSKTSSRNDPFFILNIGNRSDGSMYFYVYDWQRRNSYSQTTMNVPVGRWFQVEAYYQCAADSTGRVTIWQDGQMLVDVANVSTRYGDGDCEWSVNNYSDNVQPNPSSLFIDDAAIGLSKIGASMISASSSTGSSTTTTTTTTTTTATSRKAKKNNRPPKRS